jgi:hypothetical protein
MLVPQRNKGKKWKRNRKANTSRSLKKRGSNTVDIATVHIGGFDIQRLHATSSTNTVVMEELAGVDPIGDGVGSSGELQRVKVTALRVVALGPSRWDEGEPRFVKTRASDD